MFCSGCLSLSRFLSLGSYNIFLLSFLVSFTLFNFFIKYLQLFSKDYFIGYLLLLFWILRNMHIPRCYIQFGEFSQASESPLDPILRIFFNGNFLSNRSHVIFALHHWRIGFWLWERSSYLWNDYGSTNYIHSFSTICYTTHNVRAKAGRGWWDPCFARNPKWIGGPLSPKN